MEEVLRFFFFPVLPAPALVPDLKVKFSWGSYVELTWEELPLQERNGIITGYQLFYWDDPEHITGGKRSEL